jgi:integrase
MHACIVVSLMAGVRPEEARAIGWEEDVDLDVDPPSVAVLRADRAGGGTKTPRSRRALKLGQMAVGARSGSGRRTRRLSGRRPDRSGRTPAGCSPLPVVHRWVPGTSGRCSRTFARGPGLAGLASRDLRHTFVWLLSDDGMAIEKIARLAGHASSHVTEAVYRQELRPVLQEGAEVMDRLFGGVSSVLAE